MISFSSIAAAEAAELRAGELVRNKDTGAVYYVKTLADYGSTPDGYVDHSCANTNVLVLQRTGPTSLKQCGAKGDNSTDDTLAIQAIFDVGGDIYVPDATFLFSDRIKLKVNGTHLHGPGTFKLMAGSYSLGSTFRINPGVTNIKIEGITFDFNRANVTGNPGPGFVGSNGSNDVTITDVTITGSTKRSFSTNNDNDPDVTEIPTSSPAERWLVSNLRVLDSGDKCIQARRSRHIQFVNCFSQSNPTDLGDASTSGFETSRSFHVTFVNCHAEHLVYEYGPSYRVVNGSHYVNVIGGSATGGRQGLVCINSKHVRFEGITVEGTGASGCLVNSDGLNGVGYEITDDVMVRGCTFIDCDDEGVACTISESGNEMTNIRIEGNTFINSSGGPMISGVRNSLANVGTYSVYESGNIYINIATHRIGEFTYLPEVQDELKTYGALGDGSTDDTAAMTAAIATGRPVNITAGTYMVDQIIADGTTVTLRGDDRETCILKLNDGENDNLLQVTNDGSLEVSGLTLDQNYTNQTAGHGLRSGGCAYLIASNLKITNCYNYGIGIQAGTNLNVKIDDVIIDTVGSDAIDIKDLNLNNSIININNIQASNYGLTDAASPAVDLRGPCHVTNVYADLVSTAIGVRTRFASANGSAASGTVSGVHVTGDGNAAGTALSHTSDSQNITISNVTADGIGILLNVDSSAVGGVIQNITGIDLTGVDCITLSGTDTIINGLSAFNTAGSTRIMDFETTADNIQVNNFLVEDLSGNAEAMRFQAGATDCALCSGVVKGGTVADAGTSTIQDNVRVL